MKIVILSDSHGYPVRIRRVMEMHRDADFVCFLGDGLSDLAGAEARYGIPVYAVRGNCDCEVDQMVLEFPILADYCILYERGHMIFATHGHNFNKEKMPPLHTGDILLHGHTHIPAWEPLPGGTTYLNPGSVSIPKQNSAHSYMTLKDGVFQWKTLEGESYHQWEIFE